jgi:hypothetical protein
VTWLFHWAGAPRCCRGLTALTRRCSPHVADYQEAVCGRSVWHQRVCLSARFPLSEGGAGDQRKVIGFSSGCPRSQINPVSDPVIARKSLKALGLQSRSSRERHHVDDRRLATVTFHLQVRLSRRQQRLFHSPPRSVVAVRAVERRPIVALLCDKQLLTHVTSLRRTGREDMLSLQLTPQSSRLSDKQENPNERRAAQSLPQPRSRQASVV